MSKGGPVLLNSKLRIVGPGIWYRVKAFEDEKAMHFLEHLFRHDFVTLIEKILDRMLKILLKFLLA